MADGPCAQAELESEEAGKQYATAANAVRRLTAAEPKGSGSQHQDWEKEVGEARRLRDAALQTFQAKNDALQKCKSEHEPAKK